MLPELADGDGEAENLESEIVELDHLFHKSVGGRRRPRFHEELILFLAPFDVENHHLGAVRGFRFGDILDFLLRFCPVSERLGRGDS